MASVRWMAEVPGGLEASETGLAGQAGPAGQSRLLPPRPHRRPALRRCCRQFPSLAGTITLVCGRWHVPYQHSEFWKPTGAAGRGSPVAARVVTKILTRQ